MKLLVCGSRSIKDFDLSAYIPDECDMIITGGAKGIDTLAEKYADTHGIPKTVVLPDYEKYGKAAPILRNEQMVDMADRVLAVWDEVSSGTKYAVDYAAKQNVPVTLITPI